MKPITKKKMLKANFTKPAPTAKSSMVRIRCSFRAFTDAESKTCKNYRSNRQLPNKPMKPITYFKLISHKLNRNQSQTHKQRVFKNRVILSQSLKLYKTLFANQERKEKMKCTL